MPITYECLVLKHVREINTSPIYMAVTGGCMSQKLGRNVRFFSNPSGRGPLSYKLPNIF